MSPLGFVSMSSSQVALRLLADAAGAANHSPAGKAGPLPGVSAALAPRLSTAVSDAILRLAGQGPLTFEQESRMSIAELRAYTEARYDHAMYEHSPRTLEQAKTEYIQQMVPALAESVSRIRAEIASGKLNDDDGRWSAVIASQNGQLQAMKSGRIAFELADSSLVKVEANPYTRDSSGLVIGGGGHVLTVNGDAVKAKYGDSNVGFGYSVHFGAYAIIW